MYLDKLAAFSFDKYDLLLPPGIEGLNSHVATRIDDL